MNFNRKVVVCGSMVAMVATLTIFPGKSQAAPMVTTAVTNQVTMNTGFALQASSSSDEITTNMILTTPLQEDSTTTAASTATKSANASEVTTAADTTTTAAAEKETSPWDTQVMAKVEEFANIRVSADSNADLVGKLYKGSYATILEKGDQWTKISSGSVEGYVSNEFLAFGDEAEALAKAEGKSQATVKTTTLNVRKEKKDDAEIVTQVPVGDVLDVVAEDGDWVKVNVDGTEAYVSAEFVDVKLVLGEAISIEEELAAQKAKEEAEAAAAAEAEAEEAASSSSNQAVSASVDDVTLLAALIQCEAGGESYEGKVAVGTVVVNRLNSGYAGSISGVIYQSGQFSPASSGALASVLASGASGDCYAAAQDALAGANSIGGATSFCRTGGASGTVIGNHVFY